MVAELHQLVEQLIPEWLALKNMQKRTVRETERFQALDHFLDQTPRARKDDQARRLLESWRQGYIPSPEPPQVTQTKQAIKTAPQKTHGARGFASMDKERHRQVAAQGGRAAHAQGTAHEWTSAEARAAGIKGGSRRGRGKAPRKP